jgi:hypothetical protein
MLCYRTGVAEVKLHRRLLLNRKVPSPLPHCHQKHGTVGSYSNENPNFSMIIIDNFFFVTIIAICIKSIDMNIILVLL